MYGYEDEDEGGGKRSFVRLATGAIVVLALVGGAWYATSGRLGSDGDDDADSDIPLESTIPTSAPSSDGSITTEPTDVTEAPSTSATATTQAATTTTERPESTTTRPPRTTTTTERPESTTTRPPRTTTTTKVPRTTTTIARRPRSEPRTYDTLPDGTPAPVVAIFDVNQITLTGAVPDQAAKDRLQALAIANAKPGQADTVANFLTINPDVPRSVGVRVVELTSARFPSGSADVLPPHAAELDRVVSIMSALKNITALVIGHSDQRGDELGNYALSEGRADAVVNYLAANGVDPSRLSSRAVGEADLLTLNNDEAALALNRRTELVFYGLLIG